jgi:hypothetical protein
MNMSDELHALAVILLGEDPVWCPQDCEFCWDKDKLFSPTGNEPHQRTDVTIRVLNARSGARGRGLETASQVAVPQKGHQDDPSDRDAAQTHNLVFGLKMEDLAVDSGIILKVILRKQRGKTVD